ncbi:hypothetical protein D3C81_1098780 [compost metagenome]
MRMLGKASAGCDHVIVPHPQVAPAHALRVVVLGERKVVMGIQPAVMGAAQRAEGSEFKHDRLLKRFDARCEGRTRRGTGGL